MLSTSTLNPASLVEHRDEVWSNEKESVLMPTPLKDRDEVCAEGGKESMLATNTSRASAMWSVANALRFQHVLYVGLQLFARINFETLRLVTVLYAQ